MDDRKESDRRRYAQMREELKAKVLAAAMVEAETQGFEWITRDAVAQRAQVSVGSVNNAFGTMVTLKRAVLSEAVRRGVLPIVAQGLAVNHEIARNAPPEMKEAAAALITA